VRYFDDSIATTPGSATAALGALPGAKVIILGGSDKGGDYREVVEACRRAKASVVAIGQTGEKIAALCQELGVDVVRETGGMRAVVKTAKAKAEQGGNIILSPASASFDQYESYSDRGEQFVAAVEELL
jgi:UDP-N-acetylmuramoylalanine--D-glutamate ligase